MLVGGSSEQESQYKTRAGARGWARETKPAVRRWAWAAASWSRLWEAAGSEARPAAKPIKSIGSRGSREKGTDRNRATEGGGKYCNR